MNTAVPWGFSLNWDLFDGGRRSARIDETNARLLQVKRQREQKILEIRATLHQTLVRTKSSQAVYHRGAVYPDTGPADP